MSETPSQILDASLDHCREDERVCRGEPYCACQCARCKAAHASWCAVYPKAELDEQADVDIAELEKLHAEHEAARDAESAFDEEHPNAEPFTPEFNESSRLADVRAAASERLATALLYKVDKLLALARGALAPEATFTVNSSLPVETAFQLTLGELVEWSAGKVNTDIVMTLLVALAGAVGRGAGVTMDDSGLRAAFDHGFNTEVRDKERS